MAKLKEYTVRLNGVDHTMLLDEADSERYRKAELLVEAKAAEKPQNKAAPAPANK